MARWATWRGESGSVSIQGVEERSCTLGPGSRVDLDSVIRSAHGARPAQTLEQALGHYISLFELEVPESTPENRVGELLKFEVGS